MKYDKKEREILEQHASRGEGAAHRARMLRGNITAEIIRGLRFSNLTSFANKI